MSHSSAKAAALPLLLSESKKFRCAETFHNFSISRGRMTYAAAAKAGGGKGGSGLMKAKNSKPEEIRKSNIQAAKALAEAVRTSLGPRYN